MPTIIDLAYRYRSAFSWAISNLPQKTRNGGIPDGTGVVEAPVYTTGDVAFEEFKLYGNGYSLSFGSGMLDPSGNLGKFFAPPPMMSFRKGKKITETEVDNSDEGVIVERYTSKQWSISIQGLVIDLENHIFPKDKLRMLADVFNVNKTFQAEGQIFDALRIDTIYFDNELELAGVQGYEDTWSYMLTAKSLKPIEFFLKKK